MASVEIETKTAIENAAVCSLDGLRQEERALAVVVLVESEAHQT